MKPVRFLQGAIGGLLLAAAGCLAPSAGPDEGEPRIMATHADLVHAAYAEALVAQLREKESARDWIQLGDQEENRGYVEIMTGQRGARSRHELGAARVFYKKWIRGLERARRPLESD